MEVNALRRKADPTRASPDASTQTTQQDRRETQPQPVPNILKISKVIGVVQKHTENATTQPNQSNDQKDSQEHDMGSKSKN